MQKYEEDVDNAKNSKEACGEDEKVQFMWENHETVMQKACRGKGRSLSGPEYRPCGLSWI